MSAAEGRTCKSNDVLAVAWPSTDWDWVVHVVVVVVVVVAIVVVVAVEEMLLFLSDLRPLLLRANHPRTRPKLAFRAALGGGLGSCGTSGAGEDSKAIMYAGVV